MGEMGRWGEGYFGNFRGCSAVKVKYSSDDGDLRCWIALLSHHFEMVRDAFDVKSEIFSHVSLCSNNFSCYVICLEKNRQK